MPSEKRTSKPVFGTTPTRPRGRSCKIAPAAFFFCPAGGRVTVLDALLTIKAVLAGSYTGRYDTDANGALGRNDMIAVLKAAAAS